MSEKAIFCSCCGFIKQENEVKICTSIRKINNIGISTYLYFQTLLNIGALLLISLLVYGIFSLVTNIISSLPENASVSDLSDYQAEDVLSLSIAPKQKFATDSDRIYLIVESWLGMAMLVLWWITILFLKYFEKTNEIRV